MSGLDNHLQMVHGENRRIMDYHINPRFLETQSFNDEKQVILWMEETQNVTFYFNTKRLNENNLMMWVSYNGPKSDDREYQFSLDVLDLDQWSAHSSRRFCVPCDTPSGVVKEEYLGVVINKRLALEVNIDPNPVSEPKLQVDIQFFFGWD